MNFVDLPTDNLYIFHYLAAITILLFSINQLSKLYDLVYSKKFSIKRDISSFVIMSEFVREKEKLNRKLLKIKVKAFETKYNVKFISPIYADIETKSIDIPENLDRNEIKNYIEDYDDIVKTSNEHTKELFISKESGELYLLDLEEVNRLNNSFLIKGIFYSILIGLSVVMMRVNYSNWYSKHQFYQDGIIKSEYYKSQKK